MPAEVKAKPKESACYDFSFLAPRNFFGESHQVGAVGAEVFFRRLFGQVPKILGIFRRSEYVFTEREIEKVFIALGIIDQKLAPTDAAVRAILEAFLPCHQHKTYSVYCGREALITKLVNREGNIKYRIWVHADNWGWP